MKTFSEMRMENSIHHLKRTFEDPDTEMLRLDVDMDPEQKEKSLISFMDWVYKEWNKHNLTLLLIRDKRSTTEKKKLFFDFRWKIEQNFHKNKTMTLIQIDDKT